MSLDLFDLSFGHCLTNGCSLLDRIPYSTCACHYTSRPAVVLDSIVRQGPGHLVLDGYHCLILLEALPSSWGGGALIK